MRHTRGGRKLAESTLAKAWPARRMAFYSTFSGQSAIIVFDPWVWNPVAVDHDIGRSRYEVCHACLFELRGLGAAYSEFLRLRRRQSGISTERRRRRQFAE
jgi:hypothetical protein